MNKTIKYLKDKISMYKKVVNMNAKELAKYEFMLKEVKK